MNMYMTRKDWSKPAVYKILKGGMWWASVQDVQGKYHSDLFFTHTEAIAKAHEYAAMNRAAQAPEVTA